MDHARLLNVKTGVVSKQRVLKDVSEQVCVFVRKPNFHQLPKRFQESVSRDSAPSRHVRGSAMAPEVPETFATPAARLQTASNGEMETVESG